MFNWSDKRVYTPKVLDVKLQEDVLGKSYMASCK